MFISNIRCFSSVQSFPHKIPIVLVVFRVTAHNVAVKGAPRPKTTILMKFDSSVLLREQRLPAM